MAAVVDRDGAVVNDGQYSYHPFKLENFGPTTIEWTGYADGNGQVGFNVWDGTGLPYNFLSDAFTNESHTVQADLPLTETHIYVLISCTSGEHFTDAFSAADTLTIDLTNPAGGEVDLRDHLRTVLI